MTEQLPVIAAKLPPLSAIDASSLPQRQLERHRADIAEIVETVMSGYWRDDMPDRTRAMILADWCDEMEGWEPERVRWALRRHRQDQPNRKPNPGHILALLRDSWGRKNADQVRVALAPPVEPAKERASQEARQRILDEIGGFPAQTIQTAQDAMAEVERQKKADEQRIIEAEREAQRPEAAE